MRCLRLTEWGGDLDLVEVPVPDVGTNDVLVEVEATSVGLTVYNNITGYTADSDEPLPLIPGHEIIGRVAESGPGVSAPSEGDLVAAYYYLNCGRCQACRRGFEPLCEDRAGRIGVDRDGGFAEYAVIPAANAIELPEMDPLEATVVPDAVATPVHVTSQRANVDPGDDVMVLGAGGGVGIHLVQVAEYFGASVTAVDLDDEKLEKCEEVGAARTINTERESLSEHAERDGIRYDSIVDFTGAVDLQEESVGLLGRRGRLVNLTVFKARSMELAPRSQVFAETEVVGSRYCAKHELGTAAELVASGEIEPVISEVVDLEDVPALLEAIADKEVVGRGAVVP